MNRIEMEPMLPPESSSPEIDRKKRVILNVRGIKFEMMLGLFEKYPMSRLGRLSHLLKTDRSEHELLKICDDFDLSKNEFYFNKDPFLFNSILNLYMDRWETDQTADGSQMHVNEGVCYRFLKLQLDYWGFDFESTVQKCCKTHLNSRSEFIDAELEKEEEIISEIAFEHDFGHKFLSTQRKLIYNYMENPQESLIGKVRL